VSEAAGKPLLRYDPDLTIPLGFLKRVDMRVLRGSERDTPSLI
jgi:hypothetical protein